MFVVLRAILYASLFIGLVLVYVPARLLGGAGARQPQAIAAQHVAGIALVGAGAALVLWCVFTFAFAGKGTPAPFDPPRRLVAKGPYRSVRNPMYIGATLALAGAAAYFESLPLLGYAALFIASAHLLVVTYEEPALRDTFGEDYAAYCSGVRRWLPRLGGAAGGRATMKTVFVAQHLHLLPQNEEDVKLIGVYSSLSAAQAAIERLAQQPGFRDHPRIIDPETDTDAQGFYIDEYQVDMDHWAEGYASV